MKKFQLRFTNHIIQMITRTLTFLFMFGFFGQAAYSQIATTTPASRCGAGILVMSATATSGTIKWYDVPFYGTPVATGVSFTTPSMAVTKTYYVDAVDAGNCSLNTNQARVPVIATISANSIQAAIFYTSNTFCKSIVGNQLVTRTGTAGGVYSATAGGLTLDSSTGAITPSSSTNGTYTVTYHITTPSAGCTESDATTPVTITTTPITPVIRYAATPTEPISYCTTAGTITVIHTGASGGTYSASPTGLTIDASTGTITTATSLSGTYTVTYFVPGNGGCDAMTAQATGITILQLPVAAISYASLAHSNFTINQGTQLVSLTGTGVYTGGVYSSTTGLTIDETTGTITPASSTAGTYIVTYTLASVTPCGTPTPVTTTVTIRPLPTATIGSNQTVCQNSTAPEITFTGAGGTAPYTFTYHINSGSDQTVTTTSGNSVTVSQPTAVIGTFTYTLSHVSDAYSSSQSQAGTATITVSAISVALFTYEGTPYCSSGANPMPTMLEGGVKGTFSVPVEDPVGLFFVSAATGEIDLTTSTAGTYTVTNTIAAAGGCGIITATASVTITKLPVATFTYESTTYCQNAGAGNNPTVTYGTDGVAGIFTSVPAGVVFVSGTPGKIDLAASTPGTYSVYNTIAAAGGCADVSEHFDLTIGAPPATPAINYSGSPYCSSITEAQPVELTGTSGGAYTHTVTSDGPTLTISGTTGAITPNTSSPGVYLVTYTVGGGSGCTPVAATRSVTIYQTPVVTNSNIAICSGSNTSITLTASMPSTFTWVLGTVSDIILDASVGNGSSISQVLNNVSYTGSGTVQYIVTPTSTANACVGAPYTITVTVNPKPLLTITNPAAVCSPSTVDITAGAVTAGSSGNITGFTYWTDYEATIALSSPAAVTTSGTYYIKGTTPEVCSSVRDVTVTVNALPTITTAGAAANVCYNASGQTTTLAYTATTNTPTSYSIVWTSGITDQTSTAFAFASGGGSLTGIVIPASTAAGGYSGTMTITNGNGCTATQAVTVTVYALPAITGQPASPTAVCEGTGTPSFTVTASGQGLTYQWQEYISGWSDITEAGVYSNVTTATLTITSPTIGMNGYKYRCVVSGTCTPPVNSDGNATLTVNALPTITGEPTSPTAVCAGTGTPSFTVTATGTGLTYQWEESTNGTDWATVANNATYSNVTTATLTISNPAIVMNGYKYRCVVSGTCSPAVTSNGNATLTVIALPTITTTGAADNVCYSASGQTTTLAYAATTNTPTSYSIDWTSGITDQTSTAFAFASGGGSLTGIVIPAATVAGAYTGTMTITNANGCTATQSVSVTVNPILTASVLIEASANPVCAGTSVTFTATPTNGGTPTYQWQKGGLNTGQTGSTYSYNPVNGDIITVIMTSNASPCLSGSFVTSNARTMTVNAIPGAPTATAAQSFCLGASPTVANLATLTGTNIKWYAAETGGTAKETTEALVTATHYWASQTISGCESTARVDVTVTLTATPTYYQDSDGDGYGNLSVPQACTQPIGYVANSGDCNDLDAGVHSVDVAAIAGGASTVCIGATTPAFTDVTADGTWSIVDGTGTASIDGSGIVTGLTAGTVTVKYTNADWCGSEATTSVTVNSCLATVTTTAITTGTTTTPYTSGGNVTDGGGSTVTARGICWSTSASPTTTDAHTTNGTGTGTFTSTLSGLIAGTVYHVTAYATNSGGTAYGSDVSFTTIATKLFIGESLNGGIVFYTNGTTGLIAATADQSTGIPWSTTTIQCYGSADALADCQSNSIYTNATVEASQTAALALGMGQANTNAIITRHDAGVVAKTDYAAGVCDSYTNADNGTGVYNDWYLPSKDELDKLNLNKNAIGGIGTGVSYWSSSENTSNAAWRFDFGNNMWTNGGKNFNNSVRAIRSF